MNASFAAPGKDRSGPDLARDGRDSGAGSHRDERALFALSGFVDDMIDFIAPCPWEAHAGGPPPRGVHRDSATKQPLYTHQERLRRDESPWTMVQAILAPLQFAVFAVSLGLVIRYLLTGQGYQVATASIIVKTMALYAIMITGSIWEKEVFGKWLFARAFFWEDVFSMLVLGLQTTYLAALILGWGSPRQQIMISVAAYTAYVINASQFLWKLRMARLEGGSRRRTSSDHMGQPA